MKEFFSDDKIAQFLQKSYFATDGLWFLKTEEKHGFEEAMEIDEAVWEVMAKIQARKAKQLLGINGNSLEDFIRAIQMKFCAEGCDYEVECENDKYILYLGRCPWYEVLVSSNRTHIANDITHKICTMEIAGWAKEFSEDIKFEVQKRHCTNPDECDRCAIIFSC